MCVCKVQSVCEREREREREKKRKTAFVKTEERSFSPVSSFLSKLLFRFFFSCHHQGGVGSVVAVVVVVGGGNVGDPNGQKSLRKWRYRVSSFVHDYPYFCHE